MADEREVPNRKHLTRLARVWLDWPTYLVTIRARARQLPLSDERVAPAIIDCLREAGASCGWSVGRYVIMPNHMHFFCAPQDAEHDLSAFVGRFKSRTTRLVWERGVQGAPGQPFPDVPVDHWAFDAVEKLRRSGIIVGYPSGTFDQPGTSSR